MNSDCYDPRSIAAVILVFFGLGTNVLLCLIWLGVAGHGGTHSCPPESNRTRDVRFRLYHRDRVRSGNDSGILAHTPVCARRARTTIVRPVCWSTLVFCWIWKPIFPSPSTRRAIAVGVPCGECPARRNDTFDLTCRQNVSWNGSSRQSAGTIRQTWSRAPIRGVHPTTISAETIPAPPPDRVGYRRARHSHSV